MVQKKKKKECVLINWYYLWIFDLVWFCVYTMCRVFAIMVYQQYVYSLAFICVAHTMSLSINSIPLQICFPFTYYWFIHSVSCLWRGSDIIYTLYVLFLRFVSWKCLLFDNCHPEGGGRGNGNGERGNGCSHFASICWLLVVYPDCVSCCFPLFLFFWPPIQSSIEVYWGFYRYKILYISVLFDFFVTYTTCDTRICLRRRERISIDFFDFFNWLMVGSVAWLHVVSVHPIIWSVCSFFFALLSRGTVSVCYCSFILLLIFSLSFILLLLMYLTDGEWNAVCLSECPSLFFHFISFFQCKAPNTVWFVYSFWKRLHGFWERTTSTIPLLIGTWFNESIQFVVFDVIPCR